MDIRDLRVFLLHSACSEGNANSLDSVSDSPLIRLSRHLFLPAMTDLTLTGDNKKARGAAIGATSGRRLFSTAFLVAGGLAVMTMVNIAPWRNPFRAATGNSGGGGGSGSWQRGAANLPT
jgi:uncharacterized membrane protein YgcG